MKKTIVVAMGGNAISQANEEGNIKQQFQHTRETLDHISKLIKDGYRIVMSHGNGPQVGNVLKRVEIASDKVYRVPLGVCVADTQGGMGYMIQQEMKNILIKEKLDISEVATVVTQVVVDKNDPAFTNPTKPVGSFMTEEEAKKNEKELGWDIVEDSGRGWRRVVPSPKPVDIIEKSTIKTLIEAGQIVITVGGGGVPVIIKDNGAIDGVDAVIDKDYASALLANLIKADILLISTGVEKVAINFNKPDQKELSNLTVSEAKKYLEQGQFPKGSMGPKIEAAIKFLEAGGKRVIITNVERVADAVKGITGTQIVND